MANNLGSAGVRAASRDAKMEIEPETMIDPRETAMYIGGVARELRILAAKSDLSFLSYLLSMAEDEATAAARRVGSKGLIPKRRQDRRAS